MKKIDIEIAGRVHTGYAQKIGSRLWVHYKGHTFEYEPESGQQKKRKAQAAQGDGVVRAPMPGKINKLMVQVGQSIQGNEVLLVMEAMKMEYTLKAPINGTVEKIMCAVGEQVVLGQELVRLTEAQK